MSLKNYTLRFFFILIFLSFCFSDLSRAQKLPIRLYTSADGLASGAVLRIERDSRGFLWFSSRDGLSRFDGKEFVNYRIEGIESAAFFSATLETRDGSFWISMVNGLYRVNPDNSSRLPDAEKERSTSAYKTFKAERVGNQTMSDLFEDSRGRIWGASNELILIAENGELKLQKFDLGSISRSERGAGISSIYESGDGSLWIGCRTGAIRLTPDGRRILYPIRWQTDYDAIGTILEDATGHIWISHSTGLFVFQPESLADLQNVGDLSILDFQLDEKLIALSEVISPPNVSGTMLRMMFRSDGKRTSDMTNQTVNIQRILRSSDDKIWIPAGNSLYVYNGERCERLTDLTGANNSITSIIEDKSGSIWISASGGIIKFNRQGMTSYGVFENLIDPFIHSIYEAENGDLFIVHGDWRVSRVANTGIEPAILNVPDNDRFMWTSTVGLLDRQKNWWALSANGLYGFGNNDNFPNVGSQKRLFGRKDGFASNSMYTGFSDSRGFLWFSTRGTATENTLTKYDPATEKFQFFSEADGLPKNAAVRSYAEDAAGNVWFGLYDGGLFRYENGRFVDFSKQENLPKGGIFGLFFDSKNRLWIGSTREGLAVVENPSAEILEFRRFTTEQGLSSNNIRAVTGDKQGNIYAGTIRGVDRINPETGSVRYYSVSDGLISDVINVALTDRRGRVWFGTPNGLSRLDPESEFSAKTQSPPIFINDLQTAGVNRQIPIFGQREIGAVRLASDENNLSIGFTSIGDNLRFQYKLEGDETKNWSAPTAERTVNFAGLAPGDYKFLVRAIDANNQPSENPATISFSVAPPFWKTWQFVGALILVAAIGVFLLDRYRVAKTRQVEKALAKSVESETRFRTLAQTASDAIITIDTDSKIVFVNEAVETIFGWKSKDLIGEKLTVLMPDEFRRFHDAGLNRYVSTGRKNMSWSGIGLTGKHKSGAKIPIEVSFGEFDLDGKHYFTGVARDISERLRAEEALAEAREERLKELQKVRTRIATDLHDDIGSSLTQIAVLTEVARTSAQSETVQNPLERISNVSNELVDAMADIVWAINPKKDNLRELILRMRRFASDVLSARDIEFEFETPEEIDNISIGANIRREVFSIFKESINNTVRHSGADEVLINFETDDRFLRLSIQDNGRGFDVAEILSENFSPEKGGNGLVNMRRRAAELGGICKINSSPKGTTTRLEIPLHLSQTDDESIHITQANGSN